MYLPEYDHLDATAMADMVRSKELSAEELLRAAIDRAQARNPLLNAIVTPMFEEASLQIRSGLTDGPFRGVPFLLKDGTDFAGVRTRNGSRVFDRCAPPLRHDDVTQKYLNAGLVVFGKTSMPELGNSGTTEPVAHGPCANPWDLTRSPGGSSGGSASAVAGRIAPMASGGDGGGSIRNPASACGLVGLKPTRARVTLGPQTFEGTAGLPVVHALTRSVRDCAALLDCTAGPVLGDAYIAPRNDQPFAASVGRQPRRLKIGFHTKAHHDVEIDPECIRAVEQAANLCEELGHVVEPFQPSIDGKLFQDINLVLWSTDNLLSLSAVLDVQRDLSSHPALEWITSQIAEQAKRFSALDYVKARQQMHQLSKAVAQPFSFFDLILSPVVKERPWKLGVYETGFETAEAYFSRVYDYSPFCWPYNVSGQPAISVPFHWTAENLPVGVMFAARYGEEATLLNLASQIEIALPWAQKLPRLVTHKVPRNWPLLR